jgi:SnoaL-like domain
MPSPLVAYWSAWNADHLDHVRSHLVAAVTEDVEWVDPRDSFRGIAALETAIKALRERRPDCRFQILSEIDHHHDVYRYRWDMVRKGRTLMEGLDIVTIDERSHLIARIVGFFGDLTAIDPSRSGVPSALR